MRPAARIQATIESLASIYVTVKPADAVLSAYFRARRYMGSKDRSAVAEGVFTALRWHARIGWWLQRVGLPEDARTSAICMEFLRGIPMDAMEEICSGGQYAPAKMTQEEQIKFKKLEGRSLEHPEMPLDVKLECPAWAMPHLQAYFGDRFEAEMRALLDSAPLNLRANALHTTREELQAKLEAEGISTTPTTLSPFGLKAEGRPAFSASPTFKAGLFEVQDEGSQMLAQVVDAKAGHQVVDFCAGAGGKTLAIAAQMKNKGRIIACDIHEYRLKMGQERFRRAKAFNIETRALSSERDPWVKRHKGMFDRVLVDAPCSGVGVWRRNPDARWRPLGPGIDNLVKTQAEILDSASRLVKSGGYLVYATCSMMPQENSGQVKNFLEKHPEFTIEPCGLNGEDFMELTPARHKTDGFFAARLKRKIDDVKPAESADVTAA